MRFPFKEVVGGLLLFRNLDVILVRPPTAVLRCTVFWVIRQSEINSVYREKQLRTLCYLLFLSQETAAEGGGSLQICSGPRVCFSTALLLSLIVVKDALR